MLQSTQRSQNQGPERREGAPCSPEGDARNGILLIGGRSQCSPFIKGGVPEGLTEKIWLRELFKSTKTQQAIGSGVAALNTVRSLRSGKREAAPFSRKEDHIKHILPTLNILHKVMFSHLKPTGSQQFRVGIGLELCLHPKSSYSLKALDWQKRGRTTL